MANDGTGRRTPVQKIVGLNLNMQAAKCRLGELDGASVNEISPAERRDHLLERGKLEGEIDYCITAIKELKAER